MRKIVGTAGVAALFLVVAAASAFLVAERASAEPTIDYVLVVDAPDGGGSWVSSGDYLFGDTDTFYAAGYNTTTGWVADLTAYWYFTNASSYGWARGVMKANTTRGTSVQVYTTGYGVAVLRAYASVGGHGLGNSTGPLWVSVANVDSAVVQTDAGGAGSWVGDTAYIEGDRDTFFAAAYNASSGFLGDISSNWTSSDPDVGSVAWELGGLHPNATFRARAGGFTYVTAAPVGSSVTNTTGNLTVTGIASVRVVDAPGGAGSWVSSRDYLFADTDTFYSAGYDATGAWIADVVTEWHMSPDSGQRGGNVVALNRTSGSSVGATAVGYGVVKVYALFRHANGTSIYNLTGPLHVSVANVDSVVVRTDQGGTGTWVGNTTYEHGNIDIFYAAAYNATTGYLGDISSNWTSTNMSVIYIEGGTAPRAYPSANIYANAIGFAYVSAAPVGTLLENTTGKLTVTGIGIDYVQIRDAPNGGGVVMGTRTYYPLEQDTFYAATYNFTLGYRGDAVADWTSNDTGVCKVSGYSGSTAHGSSVQLLLKYPGTCTVTAAASTASGTVTNTTGTLTILPRTVVTVDDSGGADFTTIQAAVDYALDGYKIYVYDGTYNEHVVVTKELEIEGQSKQNASHQTVVLDGGDTGIALFVGKDRVVIHNLTVQNASYGIFQDRTNNTRLYHSVIRDYGTGLYNNYTLNAWVAYNLITGGEYGVVAYKAYDDAIRYNEISYNTEYGGKGYNAHLRNCFNWNYLHNNHIGYYYDPTDALPPMEFDGNTIADNDVGVKVSDSSAIYLTNNVITGGSEGVQLLTSSSEVRANTISDVRIGIRFHTSSSNLTGNTIAATGAGIVGDGGAPRIEGNDITAASGLAMDLSNLDGAVIQGNDVHGGVVRIAGSHISTLAPVDSVVVLVDTTVENLILDAASRVEVQWTIRVRAVDGNGGGLGAAAVSVRDVAGTLAYYAAAGPDGYTSPFVVTTEVRTLAGVETRNPFTIEAWYGSSRASLTVTVSGAGDIVVSVPLGAPPAAVAVLAAATLVSASLAGIFAVERSRYAFLAFLMPLYSRLSRDKVLENYNRGRVYEYVELNPGTHFNAILAALAMNNGALVYHLEVLQKEGLVASRQEGMYRRFYPRGTEMPPLLENGTTEAQLRVLKAIQEMPGITQKELARFLGLRQSTLAYQIDRLAATGYIASERRGRKIHYTAKRGGT